MAQDLAALGWVADKVDDEGKADDVEEVIFCGRDGHFEEIHFCDERVLGVEVDGCCLDPGAVFLVVVG